MSTITMPAVGDRVRAVCIPHVTHDGQHSGTAVRSVYNIESMDFEVVLVRENDNPPRVYGNFTYTRAGGTPRQERWYVTEWEPIAPTQNPGTPAVGDKVIPLAFEDNWFGIPEWYHDKVGTVTAVNTYGSAGVYTIDAEFPSQQKPDDTVRWSFRNWKPAPEVPITFETRDRLIGRRIKAIRANSGVSIGQEYTVTGTFHVRESSYASQKIDGITLNVGPNGSETRFWVQAYDLLPDEKTPTVLPFTEGETLIVHSRSDVYDGREVTYINVDGGGGRHAVRLDGETLYFYERHLKRPDAYVPAEGDEVIAYEPNLSIAGGPAYPGKIVSISTHGNKTWYMVAGDFNRYGINFARVEKRPTLTEDAAPAVEYVPAVGDRVRFTGCLNEDGIEDGFEREGTITAVTGNIWEIDGILGGKYVSGPGYVFPFPVEAETVAVTVEATEDQRRIERLERELEQARENNRILMKSVEDWTHDFGVYAERIITEAEERDWCSEYERVISGIESELRVATIPAREEEFEVEVDVSGSVSTSTTVTVKARSREHAEEMVRDDLDSYVDADDVLRDRVRYDGFDNTEVEVQ